MTKNGFTVSIEQDTDPMSPTERDNLGEIVYRKSSRYVLGYRGVSDDEMQGIADGIKHGTMIGIPVYAYVHSNVALKAAEQNPFSCPWDSGQSGVVYVKKSDAKKEFPRLSGKAFVDAVKKVLKGQVEAFSQYLSGDVYSVVVRDEAGEVVDSCGGFYGYEDAQQEAQSMLDAAAK